MNEELMQNGFEYSFSYTSGGTGFLIIQLIFFFLTAWGLYNINKKLGENSHKFFLY